MRKTFPNKVFSTPPASAGPSRALSSSFCLQIASRLPLPQQSFGFFSPLLLFQKDLAECGAPHGTPNCPHSSSRAPITMEQHNSGPSAANTELQPSISRIHIPWFLGSPKHTQQPFLGFLGSQSSVKSSGFGGITPYVAKECPLRAPIPAELRHHSEIFTFRTV